MPDTTGYAFDWDSTIENDGQEFIILPEGDYIFKVTNFERGRYPGSSKIPACNKASLTLSIDTPEGTAICRTDLILYSSLEWKIASFFRCIGQKKHGEPLKPDWNKVIGSYGKAHFKPRSYTKNDGTTGQTNDVDRYYDFDPKFFEGIQFETLPPAAEDEDLPF